ncbi:hypothetical protein K457DRAFT_773174 [Linnemannia elongata AG-77]|uniref:Uncharacterized protein n=1 Tax=Linnemannia elongata AG-77 TaxID=1314771 RepID=A0A197KBH8_9FUNG|nr:hypothetical protein K457DRAFT_773174 [Linnemannia elongata AG-77]
MPHTLDIFFLFSSFLFPPSVLSHAFFYSSHSLHCFVNSFALSLPSLTYCTLFSSILTLRSSSLTFTPTHPLPSHCC